MGRRSSLEEGAQVARELAFRHSSLQKRRLEQEAANNEQAAEKICNLLYLLTQGNSTHLLQQENEAS